MSRKVKIKTNTIGFSKILKVVTHDVEKDERPFCCFLLQQHHKCQVEPEGYACIATDDEVFFNNSQQTVILLSKDDFSDIQENDVIGIEDKHSTLNYFYRVGSNSNALFVTECCNSHCLMCPQPPKLENSVELEDLHRIITKLPKDLKEICVTGGEPTLLGNDLIDLLQMLAANCPECHVHMLTNGKKFREKDFARDCLNTGLKSISFGIPLYSSVDTLHNYIVQDNDAFKDTLEGIYNLARLGASIEIRVVLTKINALRLRELADFIYRNLTFVNHIALMGMEHMGYVKLNWDKVYINPATYQEELVSAVRYLRLRGMNVSIYNLPLCILDPRLWSFSRKSISDFKQGYDARCCDCSVIADCGGLFERQKEAMCIKPIK